MRSTSTRGLDFSSPVRVSRGVFPSRQRKMTPAVDMRNMYHPESILQGEPALWSDHQHPAVAATMDFAYDGVYNAVTPSAQCTAFPSGLAQTLCELDIDNSIHKLFEGLPEILDDSAGRSDVESTALARPGVPVASSPFLSPTLPLQGGRPSAMAGSVLHAVGGAGANTTAPLTALGQEFAPSDRKGKARKGRATGSGRGSRRTDATVPGSRVSAKVLDAIVPSISTPSPPAAHVANMVPKILPATAIPAADLSPVTANQAHPVDATVGLGPQPILRMPKRSFKAPAAPTANTRTQKTRYFDKVEHIVRERWRRDDMAGKFLALEALLPPGAKRDRSTVVEDTMKLVKSLQHRKEAVSKRRAELKLAAQSPGVKLSRIIQKIGSLAVIPMHVNQTLLESGHSPSSSSMTLSNKAGTKRPLEATAVTPVAPIAEIPHLLRNCVKRFYVQSELSTGDIVIEMICEQIPNFHSVLLKSMETLGLDVLRCSITQTANKLICNITVKPLSHSAAVNSSSTSIMEGLSSAFRHV